MKIIKLNAIPSTNTFLSELSRTESLEDFTVVVAENQTNGKGQRGATWSSDSGKSLTFSVLCDVTQFKNNLFLWNAVVAISLLNALKKQKFNTIHIKWPNDILADSKKIAGILIENRFLSSTKVESIVGIGVNVNQTDFTALPQASSMAKLTNRFYDLDLILKDILHELKFNIKNFSNEDVVWKTYHQHLFKFNIPSVFEMDSIKFNGIIKGVTPFGFLKVLLEDDRIQEYDIKQIKMLY